MTRWRLLHRLEPREHGGADASRVLDQVLLDDDLQGRQPRGGGERIAAVGGAAAGGIRERLGLRQLVGRDDRRERKAAADSLAAGHDVGNHLVVVDAPELSGASEARDHLVGDEECAVLLGDRAHRGQEPGRRDDVAGGALHRLDDDRGDLAAGLVPDHGARFLGARDAAVRVRQVERATVAVGVGRDVGPRHERPQAVLEVAPEQRQDAAGLSVEGAGVADELELLRDRLGQAERGLDGLRSAREELDAGQAGRRHASEQVQELRADLRREAAEGQSLRLILQSLHVVRMAVPDAADRDPGDEVDVGVAVLVEDVAAAALRHREARVEGERLQARRHVTLLELDDLARAGADLAPLVPSVIERPHSGENRAASSAAMREAATARKSAKLGQAFRSITEIAPSGETMASPP